MDKRDYVKCTFGVKNKLLVDFKSIELWGNTTVMNYVNCDH